MRPRGDRSADAIHLDLTDAAIADSREVAVGIVVAYDADGFIVGLEIRAAPTIIGSTPGIVDD